MIDRTKAGHKKAGHSKAGHKKAGHSKAGHSKAGREGLDRIELDSLGEVSVPAEALYGAQTQRALNNFQFSQRQMPAAFLQHLARIKYACARANAELGVLSTTKADAICAAALRLAAGECADQFPVDVFQSGSGTSTNMNMNEVISHLALCPPNGVVPVELHPNDDVNRSQSSNDVIPTCLQVSAVQAIEGDLLPKLRSLINIVGIRASGFADIIKTGRTHLMDAMPLSLQQELETWQFQLTECEQRLEQMLPRLKALPLGGTAVGTGVNSPPGFSRVVVTQLNLLEGSDFSVVANRASRMAAQDASLECSSTLRSLAVVMIKLSNDLRWMSSGPLGGLAEIQLTALQPGSSIMPGKVNPVLLEAVGMIAVEVIGNDMTVAVAAQSGNFQLNVMLPLIVTKLLDGIGLLSRACEALATTVNGFSINYDRLETVLHRNPILVTGLNEVVGYSVAASIAKQAYAENRPIIDVAVEVTGLDRAELERRLDPRFLAYPHGR
jgi:fumarate hydratase, class II